MTIRDIARIAKVSPSTVSNIINKKDVLISPKTREHVLAVIGEYNYTPYQKVVEKLTPQTKLFGLLVPDIKNSFYAELLRGAEDCAQKHGCSIIVCNTDDDHGKEDKYIDILLQKKVEGFMIFPSGSHPEKVLDKLGKSGAYAVLLDKITDAPRFPQLYIDDEAAAYHATKYLIEKKHRKIGCITSAKHNKPSVRRLAGYKKAMSEMGIALDESLICEGDFTQASGEKWGKYLIEQGASAIFAFNDLMACGVYRAAIESNLGIPSDLSVIGFDDIYVSELLTPPLTSIKQPTYEMGKKAMELLIDMGAGKEDTQINHLFDVMLVKRGSVRMPKSELDNRKKLAVVGNLHMEIVGRVNQFPECGECQPTPEVQYLPSGLGSVMAISAAKLGGNVQMVGRVGADAYGKELRAFLGKNHVGLDGLTVDNTCETGFAMVSVTPDAKTREVMFYGANEAFSARQIERHMQIFAESEYCVIDAGIPAGVLSTVASVCEKRNCKTVLCVTSPLSKDILETLQGYILVVPGASLRESNGAVLAERLAVNFEQGFEQVVLLDEEGIFSYSASHEPWQYPLPGKQCLPALQAVFAAALAVWLSEGQPWRQALRFAAGVMELACAQPGSLVEIPNRKDIENILTR